MAERWAAEGWPAKVDESGVALTAEFSAPSAGPPPWFVSRITPRDATALLTASPTPFGATYARPGAHESHRNVGRDDIASSR